MKKNELKEWEICQCGNKKGTKTVIGQINIDGYYDPMRPSFKWHICKKCVRKEKKKIMARYSKTNPYIPIFFNAVSGRKY